MIRVVLAALVATALLAAALPAVDDARRERTATLREAAATELADRLRAFARRNDPVAPEGPPPAQLRVAVETPDGGGAIAIGGLPDGDEAPTGDGPGTDLIGVVGPDGTGRATAALPVDLRIDGAALPDHRPLLVKDRRTLLVRLVRNGARSRLVVIPSPRPDAPPSVYQG